MHDRKPVFGILTDVHQIGIFNGLGSKGVLLGPYFARQLALFLCDPSCSIDPEVSIERYLGNNILSMPEVIIHYSHKIVFAIFVPSNFY